MEAKKHTYLEIVSFETGKVAQRFDMTGKSKREFDKLDSGINRQLDNERYYTMQKKADTKYSC